MKRQIAKILTGIALAGAFSSCEMKPYNEERITMIDGFKITRDYSGRNCSCHKNITIFERDNLKNTDQVTYSQGEYTYSYFASSGNYQVIKIADSRNVVYNRGDLNTERMFSEADEKLAEVKRDFGLVAEVEIGRK